MAQSSTSALTGRLSVVPGSKHALFEAGDLDSTSVLIFVGGLSDGLLSVGYVYGLAEALKQHHWGCAFVTLSSSFSQYGISSLERDARELSEVVKFLREQRSKDKIVLHGHSTGCQDAMQYLTVKAASRAAISGAILQAPVSDNEFFDTYAGPEAHKWLKKAQEMVEAGQGRELLPIGASQSVSFGGGNGESSESSDALVELTPFTAYRFASLHGAGGDDDFFTSTTPDDKLRFASAAAPLLLFLGEKDGAYPGRLRNVESQQELLERWMRASDGKISPLSKVLLGANHTVDDPNARKDLYNTVLEFIQKL